MLFYHFTAHRYIEAIKREGIRFGEVPLASDRIVNGVWLTTDRSPGEHGLSGGEDVEYTQEQVRNLKRQGVFAQNVPDRDLKVGTLNKRAVRLTVRLPLSDRNLERWTKWGRKHLQPAYLNILNEGGGGKRKAETWYISFRTITPSEIVSIDILAPPDKAETTPT